MAIGSHTNPAGGYDEWLTPPGITDELGPFDLDPCAPIKRPWETAARYYTVIDDGLKQPWEGMVWMNPPYGKQTGRWLEKLAHHGNGIALIFARTETAMFVEHVWKQAYALKFIYGRLHFHHVDGRRAYANAGGPSVLIAYGMEAGNRLLKSEIPGRYVRL